MSIRGIVLAMGSLGVVGVVTLLVTWYMLNGFERESNKHDPAPSPLANQQRLVPPPPWLQPSPPQGELRQPFQDMQAYRRHEDALLSSYRVIDREHGVVQIPIKRAMQILAAPTTGPTSRSTATRPDREPSGGQP